MKTGLDLIALERRDQIDKHKRSVMHDVEVNDKMQLSFAAALLTAPNIMSYAISSNNYGCPEGWDSAVWFKMVNKPYKDRLIISGALIAAELDRLTIINDSNIKIPNKVGMYGETPRVQVGDI